MGSFTKIVGGQNNLFYHVNKQIKENSKIPNEYHNS